jgi:cytochrome P450
MTEDIGRWSCYTTAPEKSLEILEEARAKCPVAFSEAHEGFYLLLNYRDVLSAMLDHRRFSSEPQVLRPMLPRKPIPALEMDPPRHRSWRAIFDAAMSESTTRGLEPFVRLDIGRHIDTFVEAGSCDIVSRLTQPVPAEAICRLMGIDEELVPRVRESALAMFAAQGNPIEFGKRQAEFAEITVSEVHKRRSSSREDYLTHLSTVVVEGLPLDDDDYVVLLAAFLGAGHHSTTAAMTTLIVDVFSNEAIRDALLDDPLLIPTAVEESLRLRPPFYGFFRRAIKSSTVAGVDIYAGSDVYLGWAAANRDASRFANPREFRLDRQSNQHLSFGAGIHFCPGAALARMELRVLLEELLRRLPDMRVKTGNPAYQFGGGDYAFIPSLQVLFTAGKREAAAS